MDRRIKIALSVVVVLAVVAGIFLLTSTKKPKINVSTKIPANVQVSQTQVVTKTEATPQVAQPSQDSEEGRAKRAALKRSQWQQCKEKTFSKDTNLFWNIQITEAIPAGGTYAKGFLDSDTSFLVHVIIKADAAFPGKIKEQLAVGKIAIVRGNCIDVASDGAVVIQAF
jgi:hypothetical protein